MIDAKIARISCQWSKKPVPSPRMHRYTNFRKTLKYSYFFCIFALERKYAKSLCVLLQIFATIHCINVSSPCLYVFESVYTSVCLMVPNLSSDLFIEKIYRTLRLEYHRRIKRILSSRAGKTSCRLLVETFVSSGATSRISECPTSKVMKITSCRSFERFYFLRMLREFLEWLHGQINGKVRDSISLFNEPCGLITRRITSPFKNKTCMKHSSKLCRKWALV